MPRLHILQVDDGLLWPDGAKLLEESLEEGRADGEHHLVGGDQFPTRRQGDIRELLLFRQILGPGEEDLAVVIPLEAELLAPLSGHVEARRGWGSRLKSWFASCRGLCWVSVHSAILAQAGQCRYQGRLTADPFLPSHWSKFRCWPPIGRG